MSTNAPPPVETVPISRLFPSPSNPRRNDAAVPHVAASLRRFGWQQPIVARRSGEVVAGRTRLKAAQELRMQEVPVWWFDGSDLDAVAYNLADNRTHEFAEWNDAELAELLEHLKAEDFLDGVGYGEGDLDAHCAIGFPERRQANLSPVAAPQREPRPRASTRHAPASRRRRG